MASAGVGLGALPVVVRLRGRVLGRRHLLTLLFHILALALLGWALIELRRTARLPSTSRSRRVVTLVLFASLLLAIMGHVVELVTALARLVEEGWANVDTEDIFEEGLHAWAAKLTVPMMMLSMLTALALVIVTTVQHRKGTDSVDLESA